MTILILAGIVIFLWTALRSPSVQTLIAKRFIENLAQKLDTKISVGKLRYGMKNNLIIRDFYIADQKNDTLFYANRIELHFKQFNLNDKTIDIKELIFKNCVGNVVQSADSLYNIEFITKAFKNNDTTKLEWHIVIKNIEVTKTTLNYADPNKKIQSNQTKFTISNFEMDSNQFNFTLNRFSNELNGISFIRNATLNFSSTKKQFQLTDFNFLTLNSFIQFKYLSFAASNSNPTFMIDKLSSRIFLHEFYHIIPQLKNRREFLTLTGTIENTAHNFEGRDLRIQLGKASAIHSNFNIQNLFEKNKISYQFEIEELFSNADDINYIYTHYLNKDSIELPDFLNDLGNVNYKGKLSGTSSMIYSNGNLTSNLGKISSDIKISKDNHSNHIYLDGTIKANPLYPNTLIKSQSIGEVAFTINTKGYYSKTDGPHFKLDGMLHHLYVNNNRVDSIKIKGNLENELFVGRISSFDDKLRFDLDGNFKYDTIPSVDFIFTLYSANLKALGINKKDSVSNLSMNVKANFKGSNFNNTNGTIFITDLFYFKDTSYFATDSIAISSTNMENGKKFLFNSEYVHAELSGNYNTLTLNRSIESLLYFYLPSLGIKPSKADSGNDFSFSIVADYPHPITEILFPNFRISSGTSISGTFNGLDRTFNISCFSDQFDFFNKELTHINLKAYTRNNNVFINLDSKEFKYAEQASLKNFMSSVIIFNDSLKVNFNWNNWLNNSYSGNLNAMLSILPNELNKKPDLKLDIFPSNIVVIDTIWYISQGYIIRDSNKYTLNNIKIDNQFSKASINGVISNNPTDSIILDLENMNVAHLNSLLKKDNVIFNGILSGKTSIKDLYSEKRINSELSIKNFTLNSKNIGTTFITSRWDNSNQQLQVSLVAKNDDIKTLQAVGTITPEKKEMDLAVQLNKQPFEIIEPFLKPNLTHFKGSASGNVHLFGKLRNPKWEGKIASNKIGLKVGPTNVDYEINDSIEFHNRSILFKNITILDPENNSALLNGYISHNQFETYKLELNLSTNKILGIKTSMANNPLYYGTVYGSGNINLSLLNNEFSIDIVATTLKDSYFYIPLEGKSDIKDNDFIEFVVPSLKKTKNQTNELGNNKPKIKMNFNLDLNVTPDAEVQIIFDPEIGDLLKANGFAQLNIESVNGGFNMYGDYNISKGEFQFTLQNVINKKLDIQPNSSVSWTGDPLNATIDLDAVYKIRKASVYDLTQDINDKDKRVEVDCHLLMSEKLINPTIKFAIQVPSSTNVTAIDQLNSLPEDELNKQVISLLLVNKFTPLYQQSNTTNSSKSLGTTTVSELLSNQLSNWLSQINSAFDLGFVYRPGDDNTQEEYEIALSTNLWNDRISVNGNVGYSNQLEVTEKSPYTTDFQVEFKVNQKGNIRLRAFQKVNNDIEYTQTPYTQGFGIFYTEEFDTLDDLLQKMFRSQSATKPKEIIIQNEDNNSSN